MTILDCGHAPTHDSARSSILPGWAIKCDDNSTMCYPCAQRFEEESLVDATRWSGYIRGREYPYAPVQCSRCDWEVVGFLGNTLFPHVWIKSMRCIGGFISTHLYQIGARDLYDRVWSGTTHGPGIYCKLHRVGLGKPLEVS